MSNLVSTSNMEKIIQPSIDDWVKENLDYYPDTGNLWWIKRGAGRQFDKPVGCLGRKGYIVVGCQHNGVFKQSRAHRIAWFLYHGVWPKDQIDHINNIRHDNRIVNLREATGFENQGNQKVRVGGSSKYKGVHWNKEAKKWHSQIQLKGKVSYLGHYDNEEEAALAYNKAALEYFGEYAKINDVTP